jgi:hypothetical protein
MQSKKPSKRALSKATGCQELSPFMQQIIDITKNKEVEFE